MKIDKTALISKKANLGKEVTVGPYTIIEDEVVVGDGTSVSANAYIFKGTTIGKNCKIHMGACIGGEPQDLAYKGEESYLKIGDNNVFREHVTVHRGTEKGSATIIGNNNYFMCLSHIAHNCRIGNRVIVCNNTLLGGYVEIEDQAFVSASCLVHQFVRIGTLAMIGGGVRLNKDFPPYMSTGTDNIVESYNIIGLRRAGADAKVREAIKQAHRILYREGLSTGSALEKLERSLSGNEIQHLIGFIKSSKRGACTAHSNRNNLLTRDG